MLTAVRAALLAVSVLFNLGGNPCGSVHLLSDTRDLLELTGVCFKPFGKNIYLQFCFTENPEYTIGLGIWENVHLLNVTLHVIR